MTCREMDGLVISYSSTPGLGLDAVEHIAGCEHCRRLVQAFDESRRASPPSAERMKSIEAALLGSLTPVRSLASASAFFIAFVLVFLAAVTAGSLLLGTNGWRVLGISQKVAMFAPLATCAGLLAFSLVRLMVPGSKHVMYPALLSIGGLLLLVVVIATAFHPHPESGFVPTGLICLRAGLMCAVPAAALYWLILRRGANLSPGLTGATAGGLAAVAGLMVLQVRCPNLNGYHILVWHWGVALLAISGGLALGRLSSWRG